MVLQGEEAQVKAHSVRSEIELIWTQDTAQFALNVP
jgi:hypothetical protein